MALQVSTSVLRPVMVNRNSCLTCSPRTCKLGDLFHHARALWAPTMQATRQGLSNEIKCSDSELPVDLVLYLTYAILTTPCLTPIQSLHVGFAHSGWVS